MFIKLKIHHQNSDKVDIIQSRSFPSLSARLTGRVFQGMRVSARVNYSNKREDMVNDLPIRLIETEEDQKSFIDDLRQTSMAEEVAFHLEYWGLKK